jgi:hypothetical protein
MSNLILVRSATSDRKNLQSFCPLQWIFRWSEGVFFCDGKIWSVQVEEKNKSSLSPI